MTISVASAERLNFLKNFLRANSSNAISYAVGMDDPSSEVGEAWGLVERLVETKAAFAKEVKSVFPLPFPE